MGTALPGSDAAGGMGTLPGSCGAPASMSGRLLLPLKPDTENS